MSKKTTETKQQQGGAYFKTDNIVIYKDDILKFNTLPNNYIDLIITSPPCVTSYDFRKSSTNLFIMKKAE